MAKCKNCDTNLRAMFYWQERYYHTKDEFFVGIMGGALITLCIWIVVEVFK